VASPRFMTRKALTGPCWSSKLTNMAAKGKTAGTWNIADAKARFSELVQKAMLGEDVVIARDHKPVLRLVAIEAPKSRRKPGSARGLVRMSPDFDSTPEDFQGYA
jgi:prevent-host-death family protein